MSASTRSAASAAAARAVTRLAGAQHPSGEFSTFWSLSTDLRSASYFESPFLTGLVLLLAAELPATETVRAKACAYVNAWSRPDHWFSFQREGIDPDLDDTSVLHYVLQQQDPTAPGRRAIAQRIAALPRRGGLYETWLRSDPAAENDVDPCVSVNVLRFLHRNTVGCGETVAAVRRALNDPAWYEGTPYYLPPLSLPYLVATLPVRLRTALLVPDVRRGVVQRALRVAGPGAPDTDLATALLVALRSGAGEQSCERIASLLLEREAGTGRWCGSGFFRGLGYWGSVELTTAVAAHALGAYAATQ